MHASFHATPRQSARWQHAPIRKSRNVASPIFLTRVYRARRRYRKSLIHRCRAGFSGQPTLNIAAALLYHAILASRLRFEHPAVTVFLRHHALSIFHDKFMLIDCLARRKEK